MKQPTNQADAQAAPFSPEELARLAALRTAVRAGEVSDARLTRAAPHGDAGDPPPIRWALVRRALGHGRPYRTTLAALLAAVLAGTTLALLPPLLQRRLIDEALPERDLQLLTVLALGMIGLTLLGGLLTVLQRYLGARVGEGLIYDLRCALYAHLQRLPLHFFTTTRTGELLSRLNNDVVGAQQAVSTTLVNLVATLATVLTTVLAMLVLDWRLTLAALLLLPLFVLPGRRVSALLRRIAREQLRLRADMNVLLAETLRPGGVLLVKLFGRQVTEQTRFAERAARVRDTGVRQALVGIWLALGLSVVAGIGTAVVFWIGGLLVVQGMFTVGTIVAFASYLARLYTPLSTLTNVRVEFATALVSFERVFEVLDLQPQVADRPGARPLRQVAGEVRFEGVSFCYPSAGGHPTSRPPGTTGSSAPPDDRVLRDVSVTVSPGQTVALVGPSGAGKTTLLYLLLRLYDPTAGRVLIDGHDLRDVTLASLAEQIGVVTQEPYLFHDTIRANLAYARPDATDAEIEAACQAAHIHVAIVALPDGYQTVVGEQGYRLSGGEKQRLAIARVLLKDPRILVLDEATAHLDSQSEALVQAAVRKAMHGRTSLVIAHRLSTVLDADHIVVLDQGRLVEQGTHTRLLTRGGLYAALHQTQFRAAAADGPRSVAPGAAVRRSGAV
jgi:ATP-binding cassette subfamily B protein